MIKSRSKIWVGHVAHMRQKRNVYRILVGNPEGNMLFGRLGTEGRIIRMNF
jgi:hypothetical protein